jgi:NAD(P)H-dependent FMN reductase
MLDSGTVDIVALNGSPHRDGNTATLMGWVAEGSESAGAQIEWIHVVDYKIQYCRGCFTCLRSGECPIGDDFQAVRERLLEAEAVVVGSPVYEGQPTSLLKALLDRLTLLHLYTEMFDTHWSVGVTTSGVAPTARLARQLAEFFGRRSGVIGAKTANLRQGYTALAEVHNPRLPDRARAIGRALVRDTRSEERWRIPTPSSVWTSLIRRLVIRPMVARNADQFAGVLRIWQRKGWL